MRKSLACRNPPNGSGLDSTATVRVGPKVVLPGGATRALTVKVCAVCSSSPWISTQVMRVLPSWAMVTSENWMSRAPPEIRIGAVQLVRLASQRAALIWAVNPAGFGGFGAKLKSDQVTQTTSPALPLWPTSIQGLSRKWEPGRKVPLGSGVECARATTFLVGQQAGWVRLVGSCPGGQDASVAGVVLYRPMPLK